MSGHPLRGPHDRHQAAPGNACAAEWALDLEDREREERIAVPQFGDDEDGEQATAPASSPIVRALLQPICGATLQAAPRDG